VHDILQIINNTGVMRPHGSIVTAAPPIRLPNLNPKTHPNPTFYPTPKGKRK